MCYDQNDITFKYKFASPDNIEFTKKNSQKVYRRNFQPSLLSVTAFKLGKSLLRGIQRFQNFLYGTEYLFHNNFDTVKIHLCFSVVLVIKLYYIQSFF